MHKVCVLFLLTLCIGVYVRERLYCKFHFQHGSYVRPIAKTQKQIRVRHYCKSPTIYYSNSSATFNIPIICCGDVETNPGPTVSLLTKTVINKRYQYSREECLNIRYNPSNACSLLSKPTWQTISELQIRKHPPTHRGCRAGVRKLKHFQRPIPKSPYRIRVYNRSTKDRLPRCLTPVQREHINAKPKQSNLPTFFMCNARSACNKFDELSAVFSYHHTDVAAITETWFRNDCSPEQFSIQGYCLFSKSRTSRTGGGVAIYAREALNPSPVAVQVPDNLEVTWVKLRPPRLPRSISCIFCAVVYYPQPDVHLEAQLTDHLIATIDDFTTNHPDAGLVILGDFNQMNIDGLLTNHNLRQVVKTPTRGNNILDKIITNIYCHYNKPQICSPVGMSDHNSVLWSPITMIKVPKKATRYISQRPMPDSSIRAFGQWLSCYEWPEIITDDDVNVQCNAFYKTLNDAIDKYFPICKVKLHCDDKPWMTGEIKSLIHRRQVAHDQGNHTLWKRLRNKVKSSIENAKVFYHATRVQRHKKSNPSRWYREIRVLTGQRKGSPNIPVAGVNPEESGIIANAINNHFVSVSSDLKKLDLAALPSYLPSSQSLPVVQPWQVNRALSQIKSSTSSGPDGISARLIRQFSVELAEPLARIINTSFNCGKVPDVWKHAIVVPIPKTSPPSIDKLRPISLTDHFAKVIEGFMAKWISQDIGQQIDPFQFGNRKCLSTSHCLINILHHLYLNAENSKTSSTILLTDFKKAFDRIDHTVAISKLHLIGVRSSAITWICDFLSCRTQCVRYHGVLSDSCTINAGVPQGTKLGPLIFLVMINDFQIDNNIHIFKYVDDLTMIECRKLAQDSQMQEAADNLSVWANVNNMKLNPIKCLKMDICFSRAPVNQTSIILENCLLETVSEVKLLGITIQNNLKWDAHIKDIEKRASAKLYMLRSLVKYGLPKEDLITVFVGYIRPLLEYASPVWSGGLTQYQNERLERVQKRALRIIFRRDYDNYTISLAQSQLQRLDERRQYLCTTFFQKTLSLTDQFKQFLPQKHCTRTLRNSKKIPDFKCKTSRMQNSPIPNLIRLYNNS